MSSRRSETHCAGTNELGGVGIQNAPRQGPARRGQPRHAPVRGGDDKKALHPKESRLPRKAIQDVIDGVPTREIARRWNASGVTTTRRKGDHTAVRQVARNPGLAGWRTH
ncbi:hypothetical protein GCM10022399_42000 [Terrabacter ginsenosidimutans]|uniref:Recombinase domain-containing protein n=1 Tax=Terrabacter ginsenosidimutans TaxID=490575 RepID=A0ABP7EQ38_9MICO